MVERNDVGTRLQSIVQLLNALRDDHGGQFHIPESEPTDGDTVWSGRTVAYTSSVDSQIVVGMPGTDE